jgi:hypothetical protein
MAYVVYLELRNKRGETRVVQYYPDMPNVESYKRHAVSVYAVIDGMYVFISSIRSTSLSRQYIEKYVRECAEMRTAAEALVTMRIRTPDVIYIE